ncbi:hypothetical protein OCF84_21315 (plasmid) [Shewanella xiamenensis]|uniref:Uncharacterized protein n=1 Tax=Shewanella xiamenensis TaxID=332186 RepID=A0ABT6UDN9_9GAMM|nr:hypothetical protein [Shewanella xiamenensis]MDI5832583.1 hypothetical protein [Shewanella xiamenensis]WHF57799.1 hypothetical protein OCF84_21315 [Shewanella xiamenensis]
MFIAQLDENKMIKVLDGNMRLKASIQILGEAQVLLNGRIETVIMNENGLLEIKPENKPLKNLAFNDSARKLSSKDALPKDKYFKNFKRK